MSTTLTVVVKIGTSSLTDEEGAIRTDAIGKLCAEVALARQDGHQVVIVTSGAIGAGLPLLGLGGAQRPSDARTLQAVSAVGQSQLMKTYSDALAQHSLVCGQVLLAPLDFVERKQYLQARGTLQRLCELGVVPIVNENDAVADDEIRFGDNDRLAALVSHLVDADLLVLLTDTDGVLTSDPRRDPNASLIAEIVDLDRELEANVGGPGTAGGSGGMASKLAAARLAAWSGVKTVIAAAHRPEVLSDALADRSVGTVVQPRPVSLPARKLWIAFAVGSKGKLRVDDGAVRALTTKGASLLAPGIISVEGDFSSNDAVEVCDSDGEVFAKGLVRCSANELRAKSAESLVIHVDDLVMVPR